MQMLPTLAQPFTLSKKTARLQAELNERIDQLNERIVSHNQQLHSLAQATAADSLDAGLDQAEFLRREGLVLLSDEFKLRQEMSGYFQACKADAGAAQTRACDDLQAVERDVAGKLLEIGFEQVYHPKFGLGPRRELVFLHPRVRHAREEVTRLTTPDFSLDRANSDRLQKIHSEAEALRGRAVALATH